MGNTELLEVGNKDLLVPYFLAPGKRSLNACGIWAISTEEADSGKGNQVV